ncbi:uncharacterized protein LTR77_008888 [Saxophila tyrrhenica]|uniref:NmrA-like domain-containing protein n=1 Tax=Saxophila tyrrhenica TaxID=1690608 RepID=A0AAV9P4E6_9PEZI|nr:hypothetical protein LTR77_008888 [Saxophila tyrrhenica]
MAIKKVALLGADGNLGPAVLTALLAHSFQATVLKRQSSKSSDEYPEGVSVAKVQDDFAVDAITPHLHGHDAVIATIKGSQTDIQDRLAQACVKAGVQRFIPADFGSVDSSSERTQDLVPLYKRKTELRERLMKLAEENSSFEWTSLVCGHFFDWSLDFLHVWLKERKMDFLDDGETKWSASTLERIGEATARILLHPDETRNKIVYVQSFCVTQDEVFAAFERATGEKWEKISYDAKKYEAEEKRKADAGDLDAVENLVWLLGALDANWEAKQNFAMKTLGLENENLDAAVQRIVKEKQ